MEYASADLRREHDGIGVGLGILERLAKRVQETDSADLDDVNELIGFFKLFADKCHHGKEENLYFPALERAGVPRENGPIGQMLVEHAEGRKLVVRMAAAAREEFAAADFARAATSYVLLLRAHIRKENEILFRMGDERIPSEEQRELLESFEKFEAEVMGQGVHERLHQTLARLDGRYPEV